MNVSATLKSIGRSFAVMILLYSCTEPDSDIKPENPNPFPSQGCTPNVNDGYLNKISFSPSEKVIVYIDGSMEISSCALTIYTLSGDPVFSVATSLHQQEMSGNDPSVNGYGYSPTVEFSIPAELPSGVYTVEHKIPFIVKPKAAVEVLVVYASNTANAYATTGGRSLYTTNRPSAVSFHRPIPLEPFSRLCLDWFSSANVSVGFIADTDLDDYEVMSNAKVLAIVGHNEYWTRKARTNFDQFVDSGGDAVIFSGNTMWWQVRYSDDGSQLVCYKSYEGDPIVDPLLKTFLWNDVKLDYPIMKSLACDFDHGGYGMKSDQGWNGYKIASPNSPLLEGTNLVKGSIISCPSTEYDGAPIKSWDLNGYPTLDIEAMNVWKAELIGFDKGFRSVETYGTFTVLQRTPTSGVIINSGSTDWCSSNGMGGSSAAAINTITQNAIHKLLNDEPVFTQ